MSALKSIAERVIHSAGAMHLVRAGKTKQCRILMYHAFPGSAAEVAEMVTRQCEHLLRYYHPVSLDEIAEALRTNSPLPPNGLAVTVDDGYRDLRLAFPIFHSFGFAVTVYVVSEFSDGRLWLWPDRVKYAFRNTTLREVSIPRVGTFAIEDPELKARAGEEVEQAMMRLPNGERLEVLQALGDCFAVTIPAEPPVGCEPLSWTELRAMAEQGLDIGAHTSTHPILSRVESREGLMEEIGGCKRRIEEGIGRTIRHFCYPNGRAEDYTEAAVGAVREAGYLTAVTTDYGLVKDGADPFRLPRLGVQPHYAPLYFERCVAGFHL